MKAVSVIIPTYNRFSYLQRAVDSIRNQTFITNGGQVEIVIVNDKSTQLDYTTNSNLFASSTGCSIKLVHLEKNSKELLGFACAGYVRNIGVQESSYPMIAFVDDDDWMVETRLEVQYNEMINRDSSFSCTDGYAYDTNRTY